MKKIFAGIIALAIVLFSAPAYSADQYYVGGNYSLVSAEASSLGLPVDYDFGTLSLLGGAYINEFFAVEARLGIGLQDDDSFPGLEGEIDSMYGLYVRAEYPIHNFKPYLVVGFTEVEIALNSVGISSDDAGFSYGVGMDYKFNDKFAVNLEYM